MPNQLDLPLRRVAGRNYAYSTLAGVTSGTWQPIIVLHLADRNLPLVAFGVLTASVGIAHLISEVPTGVIADRISRKWSLTFASLLHAVAMLMLAWAPNVPMLVLVGGLYGLGASFLSGAGEALLYDKLKDHGLEKRAHEALSSDASFSLAGTLVGIMVTSLMIQITELWVPLVVGAFAAMVAAGVAASLVEPVVLQQTRTAQSEGSSFIASVRHVGVSLRAISHAPALSIVAVSVFIQRIFQFVPNFFAQLHLRALGLSASGISSLYILFRLGALAGARSSGRITSRFGENERWPITLVVTLAILSLALLNAVPIVTAAVLALVGINFMAGVHGPLVSASLNRRLASETRASALSFVGMTHSVSQIVVTPVFSGIADATSLDASMSMFGWIFSAGCLVALGFVWMTLSNGR